MGDHVLSENFVRIIRHPVTKLALFKELRMFALLGWEKSRRVRKKFGVLPVHS
jgi:hypothetical protein